MIEMKNQLKSFLLFSSSNITNTLREVKSPVESAILIHAALREGDFPQVTQGRDPRTKSEGEQRKRKKKKEKRKKKKKSFAVPREPQPWPRHLLPHGVPTWCTRVWCGQAASRCRTKWQQIYLVNWLWEKKHLDLLITPVDLTQPRGPSSSSQSSSSRADAATRHVEGIWELKKNKEKEKKNPKKSRWLLSIKSN